MQVCGGIFTDFDNVILSSCMGHSLQVCGGIFTDFDNVTRQTLISSPAPFLFNMAGITLPSMVRKLFSKSITDCEYKRKSRPRIIESDIGATTTSQLKDLLPIVKGVWWTTYPSILSLPAVLRVTDFIPVTGRPSFSKTCLFMMVT